MQHGVIIKKTYVKKYVAAQLVTMIATTAKKWLQSICCKVADVSNYKVFKLKHYQKVFTPPQRACVSIVIGIQNYTKELR